MSDSGKKQNFLHGAALLAIATAVVKVIGALYKIPLKMIIGDQGYSYFITAYDIYSVLLMICTAGLPVAMSRMISQASSLNHNRQVRRVYKTSRMIFLILGILSSLLMLVFCKELAIFQGQPDAWIAVACLAPCALLMCIMSTFRGFFQGQGNMRPTSNSQMLEAVIKLVVGLTAAFLLMRFTDSVALAAGGAILGVTISCLVSVFFLYGKFRAAYRELPQTEEEVRSYSATAKSLLAIAIPITIGSAGQQILAVVETNLYMSQLRSTLDATLSNTELLELLQVYGYSGDPASVARADAIQYVMDTRKGIYNMTQTIYNMPCAFIIPITTSVLPAITSQLTLKDDQGVRTTEESAARITGLMTLPCMVGLMLLAGPVMALLGGYSGEKLELARQLMTILSVSIFLYGVMQYTNVILQSHGYAYIPAINMLLSGVLKLVIVYVLVGNPNIGILGVPVCTAVGNLFICLINLIAIKKTVPQKPKLIRNLLRPALPAAIMGVAVFGVYRGLRFLLGADGSRILLCLVPVVIGVVVYFAAVVLCRVITKEDCQLLPKGDKIAKLLRL